MEIPQEFQPLHIKSEAQDEVQTGDRKYDLSAVEVAEKFNDLLKHVAPERFRYRMADEQTSIIVSGDVYDLDVLVTVTAEHELAKVFLKAALSADDRLLGTIESLRIDDTLNVYLPGAPSHMAITRYPATERGYLAACTTLVAQYLADPERGRD